LGRGGQGNESFGGSGGSGGSGVVVAAKPRAKSREVDRWGRRRSFDGPAYGATYEETLLDELGEPGLGEAGPDLRNFNGSDDGEDGGGGGEDGVEDGEDGLGSVEASAAVPSGTTIEAVPSGTTIAAVPSGTTIEGVDPVRRTFQLKQRLGLRIGQ
jgi:hypothetical protein